MNVKKILESYGFEKLPDVDWVKELRKNYPDVDDWYEYKIPDDHTDFTWGLWSRITILHVWDKINKDFNQISIRLESGVIDFKSMKNPTDREKFYHKKDQKYSQRDVAVDYKIQNEEQLRFLIENSRPVQSLF